MFKQGWPWHTKNESAGSDGRDYPTMVTCGMSGKTSGYILVPSGDEVILFGGDKISFIPNVPVLGSAIIGK